MDPILIIIFFQIVLESFPISSSGHIFLIQRYLGGTVDTFTFFDELLHIPTIFVLAFLFRKSWAVWIKRFFLSLDTIFSAKKSLGMSGVRILLKLFGYVCITNSITLVMWALVKVFFKHQAWFVSPYALLCGFFVTAGFLFFLLRQDGKEDNFESLNIRKVLILGCVQACALLPGISRFASVYATARLLNLRPRRAFEFCFLMQFALLVPASIGGVCDVMFNNMLYTFLTWQVLLVVLMATVIAYWGLKLMQGLALGGRLGVMFFYMIIPIFFLLFFMTKFS